MASNLFRSKTKNSSHISVNLVQDQNGQERLGDNGEENDDKELIDDHVIVAESENDEENHRDEIHKHGDNRELRNSACGALEMSFTASHERHVAVCNRRK